MGIIDVTAFNKEEKYEVSNEICTLPNLITFIRLCLIPAFLVLLLDGHDLIASIVFGVTAATDFVDGQLARRTNSVSRLGQFLDPLTDRLLMIAAVIGLLLVGRLPLWLIVLIVARDVYLLIGGTCLLKAYKVRVAVIYLGKAATAIMFIGCAFLLLNWPIMPGLGITELSWLPGFTSAPTGMGIWLVYLGFLLAIITTIYYTYKGAKGRKLARTLKADFTLSDTPDSTDDSSVGSSEGRDA